MSEKKRHTLWIDNEIWQDLLSLYKSDNCSTQNEFVENALRFYCAYVHTGKASQFLPEALRSTLEGTLGVYMHSLGSYLFKHAVETNLMNHILACDTDMDQRTYELMRGRSFREVKATNGGISFKDALDFQKTV